MVHIKASKTIDFKSDLNGIHSVYINLIKKLGHWRLDKIEEGKVSNSGNKFCVFVCSICEVVQPGSILKMSLQYV